MSLLLSQIGAPPAASTGVPFILYAGRIDTDPASSPVEFWQQRFLSRGSFAAAAPVFTSVPRWLSGNSSHEALEHVRSYFLARSRGEDRFLHRVRSAGLQRHEVPDEKYTQQFLRKGVGEDRYLHRILTPGLQRHEVWEETAIPILLRRGRGDDPRVPNTFGQSRFSDPLPYDESGTVQFFSKGSFVAPVAPSAPIINFLFLNGIAYDAFVFDDYAVLFPSKFIHVGSDAPPPTPGSPMVWQYLARTKGRWGR